MQTYVILLSGVGEWTSAAALMHTKQMKDNRIIAL